MNIYREDKIIKKIKIIQKKIIFATKKRFDNTIPVFIQGCGRSGTTMILEVFMRDERIYALEENDKIIAQNYLLIYDNVDKIIDKCKAKHIVMKPILNSFEAKHLLERYGNAKTIWMVRNYKDMVQSSIKKFGEEVPLYLKEYILFGRGDNWISRYIPEFAVKKIRQIYVENYSIYDWMALVWWCVNSIIIEDKLLNSNRLLLVRYENLVQKTEIWLKKIYEHIDLEYRCRAAKYVHDASVGRGSTIRLHPKVDKICNELDNELRNCEYRIQS